ncbi:hypothetical protein MPLB_210084 [Mesorhizobium sp. ORS 3324]|nr:hypothetical protein MPLB_210084 [Mesorhizobium sp. ORS 3324]
MARFDTTMVQAQYIRNWKYYSGVSHARQERRRDSAVRRRQRRLRPDHYWRRPCRSFTGHRPCRPRRKNSHR